MCLLWSLYKMFLCWFINKHNALFWFGENVLYWVVQGFAREYAEKQWFLNCTIWVSLGSIVFCGCLYFIYIAPMPHTKQKAHHGLICIRQTVVMMLTFSLRNIFLHLLENLHFYTRNVQINILKSNSLWHGSWKNRQDKPLGIFWNNTGLKYSGV